MTLNNDTQFSIGIEQWLRTVLAAFLMIFTYFLLHHMIDNKDVALLKSFDTFPLEIGEWHGKISYFEQSVYNVLGVDDSILINFSDNGKQGIQLYVGYYESQRKGDLIHSPLNCMPGSGWNIIKRSKVVLQSAGEKKQPVTVNRLVLKKGIMTQVAYYWFQSRGRIIHSEYWQKLYLVWDNVIKGRTDGSFVRLMTGVQSDDVETADRLMTAFASQLVVLLDDYVPGKMLVKGGGN